MIDRITSLQTRNVSWDGLKDEASTEPSRILILVATITFRSVFCVVQGVEMDRLVQSCETGDTIDVSLEHIPSSFSQVPGHNLYHPASTCFESSTIHTLTNPRFRAQRLQEPYRILNFLSIWHRLRKRKFA